MSFVVVAFACEGAGVLEGVAVRVRASVFALARAFVVVVETAKE